MGKLLLQLLMGQTSIRKMVGLLLHQGLTMSCRSKLANLDMAYVYILTFWIDESVLTRWDRSGSHETPSDEEAVLCG